MSAIIYLVLFFVVGILAWYLLIVVPGQIVAGLFAIPIFPATIIGVAAEIALVAFVLFCMVQYAENNSEALNTSKASAAKPERRGRSISDDDLLAMHFADKGTPWGK